MAKGGILAAAVVAAAFVAPAQATLIYGVDEQNRLVSFDSAAPLVTLSQIGITGTEATMRALDFRANGQLYGLGGDYTLYTINTATGAATAVGGPLALAGTEFAFDFNTGIDRIRVVSNTGANYVVDPNTGGLTTATNVFYAPGDVNAGQTPIITAVAYNPLNAASNPNQLYALDSRGTTTTLARMANSAGTLNTVGSTSFNFGPRDSFDIDLAGTAFAQDGNALYTVNLGTGAFTFAGNTDRTLYGIAAAVPEPATWAMMIGGFGFVGGTMRRRRATLATA